MRIISGSARGTKLFTLEGLETRPTLDRIKEPLFSIIQSKIINAKVLDLFAGSGALGIEALSRGAKECVLCDCSNQAGNIIKKNIEKTKVNEKATVIISDYNRCLKHLEDNHKSFDIIFLDPPYESEFIYLATKQIIEKEILNKDGIIIAETDQEDNVINQIKELGINIKDIRKYGRVTLLFIERKG